MLTCFFHDPYTIIEQGEAVEHVVKFDPFHPQKEKDNVMEPYSSSFSWVLNVLV